MLLLTSVFLLFAAPSPDQQQAGLQALEAGKYAEAEAIFSTLVQADPKNYFALFNLALAETQQNRDTEAADHYKQVLQLKPGLYEAELNLAVLDLRDKKPAEAIPLLEEVIKAKPDQAKSKRYLADAYFQTQNFAAADTAYQQAVAADPKSAQAELGLARTLQSESKLDDAIPHYQKAAELDSRFKPYLLTVAQSLLQTKRIDDAAKLIAEFPDDATAHAQLGEEYLDTNRPADAVAQLQMAVKIAPTRSNQLALAQAYLKNKQPDLAQPILAEALRSNPNDFDVRMALGSIQLDKRQFLPAAEQFVLAAKLKPDSVEAWNNAASALILAEQYPQALGALDQVRRLNAEKPADFYWRAVVLDKLHQNKPALESYQKFLQVAGGKYPDQEFVARQRARILQQEMSR